MQFHHVNEAQQPSSVVTVSVHVTVSQAASAREPLPVVPGKGLPLALDGFLSVPEHLSIHGQIANAIASTL